MDYILYNELTFVNERTKEYQSLFTSWSDSKTEAEINRLLRMSDNYIKKNSSSSENNIKETIDPIQQIKKLKELLDMGAISEAEFKAKKEL